MVCTAAGAWCVVVTLILGGLADTIGADLVDRVVYEDSESVGVMAGIEISPDGRNLYVTTSEGIRVWKRDTTTGRLSGDIETVGTEFPLTCALLSPDGDSIYTGGSGSDAITYWKRDRQSGSLTKKTTSESGDFSTNGISSIAMRLMADTFMSQVPMRVMVA